MRILGVTQKWPKLAKPRWTTFRLRRRDKDWQEEEEVQVVLHPRKRNREVLGTAIIIRKQLRHFFGADLEGVMITEREAKADGFTGSLEMLRWMLKAHGPRIDKEPINKLTLEWLTRF